MKRSYLRSKSPIERKLCKRCQKNRKIRFYATPRAHNCTLCIKQKKGEKKKIAKLQSQTYWVDKMDTITRTECYKRGHCEGDREHSSVLQWAHIVSRRYKSTRWRLDNCFLLCSACHTYYTHRPLEWDIFVAGKIGEEKYLQLKKDALVEFHKSIAELEEMYQEMIEKY